MTKLGDKMPALGLKKSKANAPFYLQPTNERTNTNPAQFRECGEEGSAGCGRDDPTGVGYRELSSR